MSIQTKAQAEQSAQQGPVAWLDGPHLVMRSDWRDRANYKGPWVDFGLAIPDSWVPVLYTTPQAQPVPKIAIADAYRAGVDSDIAAEREACARVVEGFARTWWKIHCDSNKHLESTLKAHQDFCALQAAIRARGNP